MGLKSEYSPLNKPSLENIYSAFVGLSQRDQLIGMIAGSALIVLLIILPLSMISGKILALKKDNAKSQERIDEVLDKIAEYKLLQTEIAALEKKIGSGVSSMTSTVESLSKKANMATNIEVLKGKDPVPGERFSEIPVELTVSNVTLKKLVDLIYRIETYPSAVLRIRSLQVKPKQNNRAFLDVTLDIANIQMRGES